MIGLNSINSHVASPGFHLEMLVRVDQDPDELYIDVYEVKDDLDLKASMKKAVKYWLETEEGQKQYADNNENFNWGDATYMPSDFTIRFGFSWVMQLDWAQNSVDQNESLDVEA